MKHSRNLVGAALFMLACALPLFAADGRIPIYGPTVISASGSYVLTRSFASGNDPVIEINARNVVLDLNGHYIQTGTGNVLIDCSDQRNITIKNGTLRLGSRGIQFLGTFARGDIRVENVTFQDTNGDAIYIDRVERIDVIDCRFQSVGGRGIYASGYNDNFSGHIKNNTFQDIVGHGIDLYGAEGCLIKNNVLRNFGTSGSTGYGLRLDGNALWDNGHNHVVGNTLTGKGNSQYGIYINSTSPGNVIKDNYVEGSSNSLSGIVVLSSDNRFIDNCSKNYNDYGILVGSGEDNLLDGNQTSGNGLNGFLLGIPSTRYRNNMCTDGIVGGTDEGGNLL